MPRVSSTYRQAVALGYPETGPEPRELLVPTQVNESEQGLLEAIEIAPAGAACPAMPVQQPGNMLDELMRDVEHGGIRNQQGPFGRRYSEWNHHATDQGPCLVTTLAD